MCHYLYCSRPMVVQQVFTIYRWLSGFEPWPLRILKEQRKKLIVVVSQTLVSKYLLTSYYYIEHSYQHYYLNKGQLISEELVLIFIYK